MSVAIERKPNIQTIGPFDSLRDYVGALEARGLLVRVKEIDQDQYHATGLMYRLFDKFGADNTPAVIFERIKTGGEWRNGPVIANLFPTWANEALPFGVEEFSDDKEKMRQLVMDKVKTRLDDNGNWKRVEPVTVQSEAAPCKDVLIDESDIDILKYPWFKNNPADAGRYVNVTSVILEDPELGRNVGTYRCQVKERNKIGLNPEPGQHGWRILTAKKRRGEKMADVAICLGVDPLLWCTSCTKLAGPGEDEVALAGGLRGKPVEMVKCETNDLLVPAHAEMIIEGKVPLDETEAEGPYGEMYGYMGPRKENNFFVNIKCITHRRDPWFQNSFTGLTDDLPRTPLMAASYARFKRLIPGLVAIGALRGASGVTVLSIDKRFAGEGIMAGQYVAANSSTKIVIVVDRDVNVVDEHAVFAALGSRWQPTASAITNQTRITLPDPSLAKRGLTSKIVIDATRQFPEEGGPPLWAPVSRDLLVEGAPGLFERIDAKFDEFIPDWPR